MAQEEGEHGGQVHKGEVDSWTQVGHIREREESDTPGRQS